MIISGISAFFKVITFLGAYIKFTLEKLFCRLFQIPPSSNEDNHSFVNFGHAVHFKIEHAGAQFMLCFFPSIIMLGAGLLVYCSGIVPLLYLGVKPVDDFTGTVSYPTYIMYIVFTVIGVMFLSNVLPSITDIMTFYEIVYVMGEASPLTRIVAFVPCMLTFLFSFLERTGITTILLTAFPIVVLHMQR